MASNNPAKRRRGGQPGNQNAKGNRGNRNPRPNYDNRGGGAPLGNQNARKRPTAPHAILLRDYRNDPEFAAWIKAHRHELDMANFQADDQRDPALYSGFKGCTPEKLAESGQEYRLGVYSLPEVDASDDEGIAA